MSIYIKETDRNLSDVFQRADEEMYADKRSLKENVTRINKCQEENKKIEKVPAIRKARLDSFFKVFKMAAGKGNIFFCDIRYDFSRWDKQVVDNYGLPSEYMFNAGGIWEEKIHPSDRENYNKSVETAFDGGKDEFELSYRVKENSGNYVPCTCKGLVVRNQHGEPEYFGGALFISEGDTKPKIPEERKKRLNSLFDALSIISEDSNVYLCDMHYDYSKWSKGLVEEFGMPSEYMYNAGGIWEEHVHPQDRQIYRDMMDGIFHFKTNGLDLQYRVRRADGEYNVCSALGMLIKDENGYPE
jgi:PAS domain-containing protein